MENNPEPGDTGKPPLHLAVIMDGNGRWAEQRNRPRIEGHQAGVEAVRRTIEGCREFGIKYLTLYAFSSENWHRPQEEIEQLMALLRRFLKERRKDLHKYKIRLRTIGNLELFPEKLQEDLRQAVAESAEYDEGCLILALSYGGRDEITRAARDFAGQVKRGEAEPEDLTEQTLNACLDTAGVPDPDLIIRTSGEMRLSNFLLWQASYAEFWFSNTLWPDFGKKDLKAAIMDFNRRQRRYGKRG